MEPAVTDRGPRLGERLVRAQKLGARELEQARAAQGEMGGLFGRVLVRLGLVSEVDVARALAAQLDLPLVTAEDFPQQPLEVAGLAAEYLRQHGVLPLRREGGRLAVALAVPQDAFLRKALHLASGLEIVPHLAPEGALHAALARLYDAPPAAEALPEALAAGEPGDDELIEHLRDLASEAPVIRLVNELVARAVELRASDLHIEPFADGLHLRYRVDGVLHAAETVATRLAPAVTSRIKLLARLDIAERRLPQDGRIMLRAHGRELDLRVATLPTVHGESVVLRLLDRASVRPGLDEMGFAEAQLARLRALLARPHGILLVTGPTGSGKTTTLYAALAGLDAAGRKILTVEDPVEYQLPGINQVQVQPRIGLTFAQALRAILRQDPDIILIGEMRDAETARIAVQAALTGHLVLSTLHTHSATAAVVRLEDMGVERYLVTATVNGVLAQRLVRRLCPHCRVATARPDTPLARLLPPALHEVFAARGCAQCKGSGYLGRCAIHELFVVDEAARRAILAGADAATLAALARAGGLRTLREDGLRLVAAGVTSLAELLRVTAEQDGDA